MSSLSLNVLLYGTLKERVVKTDLSSIYTAIAVAEGTQYDIDAV